VYEIDPVTGDAVARPAVGSRSHEGLRFDAHGNFYGISETSPGFIYKFVPDAWGDLSAGQLYALKVTSGDPDRVGAAVWVPLDRNAVQVRSDPVAAAAGATGYGRPEDVEIAGGVLYVAITSEHRVIGIDLGSPDSDATFVFDLVRVGVQRRCRLPLTRQPRTRPGQHAVHCRGSRRQLPVEDDRR